MLKRKYFKPLVFVTLLVSMLFQSACDEESSPTTPEPVDYIAPFIEWLAPESDPALTGTVELVFTVYDENTIDRIQVYRNGYSPDEWDLTVSDDTLYSLEWDTELMNDGVYILEARAWDTSGNLGTSPSLMVNIKNNTDPPPDDRLAPYVYWIAPEGGSTLKDTVSLQVGLYDENGIDSVKVYVNGALFEGVIPPCPPLEKGGVSDLKKGKVDTDDAISPFLKGGIKGGFNLANSSDTTITISWNTLDYEDGVYILEARAWDTSGNLGTSPSLMVNVKNNEEPPPEDRTPPVVSWVSPEPGTEVSGDVELCFQVMDDVGLDSVQVYLNGQKWQNFNYIEKYLDENVIWTTSDYSDDDYIIEVRAWDSSGNMGVGVGVVLTVRNNHPRVIWVPDDYEKIQDAIWRSKDGDTIMVRKGEYHEQLQFFDKNVSLISESGPEETTIDGTRFYSVALITGGQDTNMVVSGFKFINNSEFQCRCLDIFGGSSPKIFNNIFTLNLNANQIGDGIWTGQTAAIIRNNLIINMRDGVSLSHSWGDFSNNMIIHALGNGFYNAANNGQPLVPDYNLFWDYRYAWGGSNDMEIGEHNIYDSEPLFEEGSYRLREGSPGIDQGRPDLRDPDGSRSDIGVYGGPYAY
jgi:hypothetical protein